MTYKHTNPLFIILTLCACKTHPSDLQVAIVNSGVSSAAPSSHQIPPLMKVVFKTGPYAVLAKKAYDALHQTQSDPDIATEQNIYDIEAQAIATTVNLCIKRSADCPIDHLIEPLSTDLSNLLVAIEETERWLLKEKNPQLSASSSQNKRLSELTQAIHERSSLCELLAAEPITHEQSILKHPLIIELRNKEANASMGQLKKALSYYNLQCQVQQQHYQTIECGLSQWKKLTRVTIPKKFLTSFQQYAITQKIGVLNAQLITHELVSALHAADEPQCSRPLNGHDVRKMSQLLNASLPKPRHLPIALAHSKRLCDEAEEILPHEANSIPEITLWKQELHKSAQLLKAVCSTYAHVAIDSSDLLLVKTHYEKTIKQIEELHTRPVFESVLEEAPYELWPMIAKYLTLYRKGIDYLYLYWVHTALQHMAQHDIVTITLSDREIFSLFGEEALLSTGAQTIELPEPTRWALVLGEKAHELEDNARLLCQHIQEISSSAAKLADIEHLASSPTAREERLSYKERVLDNQAMHTFAEKIRSSVIETLMPGIAQTPDSELLEQPVALTTDLIKLLATYYEYNNWYYKLLTTHGLHEKKDLAAKTEKDTAIAGSCEQKADDSE